MKDRLNLNMSNEEQASSEAPVIDVSDDLDAFSADFFNQKTPEKAEEIVETEDDANENEDTHSGEDDTPAQEESDELDEDEEETPPEPVKKKSRAQERIEELNAKYRETERKLAEVMAKLEQKEKPEPVAQVETVNQGPQSDDLKEDGTEKYPLGEFDPTFIRDLTRYTLQEERNAMKVQEQADKEQEAITNQKASLHADWNTKLVPAQERYPDFMDKGQELISSFDGIDPKYGEYLTDTIMSLDYGTDVLYYLASHPDEAKTIVASGATKATIALGRIEAKFANAEAEKQLARPKISKAPPPPQHVNRGSAVARADVAPDTDDLDAFSSEFFKKKGRK